MEGAAAAIVVETDMLPGTPTDGDSTDPIIVGGIIGGATVAMPRDPDGHPLVLRDRP
ncbi:MAG: hypothetical protein KGQ32_01060 [Xanthomonadaceae bacterium]|nr:hypothetical protein [Xanthomonadaceae bacterium]MDE2054066.1 hypothetical protein [Xanthomonadaceae bacterium]MDE2223765.1 hypothetical protein [Xanthomonadaceae bacterium]